MSLPSSSLRPDLCIVLDLDGTLISDKDCSPRPHLAEFLAFCFNRANTVVVWTAASREHFYEQYKQTLGPILDSMSCAFHFVYTSEHCRRVSISDGGLMSRQHATKPLKKIWRSMRRVVTKHNTIVIDDTPLTYKFNYGNAIQIQPFTENDPSDNELVRMCVEIDKRIKRYDECGSVR